MSIFYDLEQLSNENNTSLFYYDRNNEIRGLLGISADGSPVPRDFALLKIYVSLDSPDFVNIYRQHILAHNTKVSESVYPDSGFDVFIPEDTTFTVPFQSQMVPLGIKTEMVYFSPSLNKPIPAGFDMRPRSSISKSSLILSNHVGTIDSGYRGQLIGAFRWLPVSNHNYTVEKNTRLLQLCHPSLCPILAVLVDSEEDLSTSERGAGGFGSTGIQGILPTI